MCLQIYFHASLLLTLNVYFKSLSQGELDRPEIYYWSILQMRKLRLRSSQHWVGFNPPCPKTKASAPSSLCCLRLETHRDHKFRERGAPWRLKHSKVKVIQLHVTLWDPMDCSPPGSTVHGILQASILEWVAIPFSKGSSWPRNWT